MEYAVKFNHKFFSLFLSLAVLTALELYRADQTSFASWRGLQGSGSAEAELIPHIGRTPTMSHENRIAWSWGFNTDHCERQARTYVCE